MKNYDTVMKLALERGFYFPSCEIYADAHAGFWEYGPTGNNLKNNFIELWRRELLRRDDMIEIDGSQIMSRSVFVASGHLDNFTDPIIKCKNCGATFRADRYITEKTGKETPELLSGSEIDKLIMEYSLKCGSCNGPFHESSRFNMMFKVEIGPSREQAYLRPETCQTIFVDFPRLFKTMRGRLPLAVAQVGKSFRNEIAPRQSLLRLREFYQAEIEVFCNPSRLDEIPKFEQVKDTPLLLSIKNSTHSVSANEALQKGYLPNKLVAYYLSLLSLFYGKTGIDMERTRFRQLSDEEKAFYATIAFDFEVETSIGWLELVACNYRSDYDLKRHSDVSKQNLHVVDPSDNSKVLPHLFELSMGIDRSIYSILEHSYYEDTEAKRVVLKLVPQIAPVLVGVFPLVTKDGLREKALEIYSNLKLDYSTFYDESGSIGRRYRRLEEIGAPFALTIDNQTMKDDTVTIRHRDTMSQDRIKVSEISNFLDTII
ncbi:MAG: glycine--tRNA ligase [Nitrososphaeraceae archaeon]|nr:glycine--tRNA ligase [Nitrososphaeraceae archaeon]MDW0265442.1 glycine--tRNA ligase [Nitrososphaeraceae archaeon]